MTNIADLTTPCAPNWCPGCGDIAIWGAFKSAAVKQGWDNTNTALVAGIGCHGHLLNFTKLPSFEGLHGRALPVATGIKIVNPKLNVFVFTGDGDSLAEGGNHFVHTCRRNHDIKIFLHDNAIYGLTTGQTSPTSPHDYKSKSTPMGNPDNPINPITLAIASGATWVARGFAGNIPALTELMIKASLHQGVAVLDILQPCITWNKNYTPGYYQENTYQLSPDYNVTDKNAAFAKSLEWGPKQIPLGVFYDVSAPSYESQLPPLQDPSRPDLSALFNQFV
jgi:2-oxoglutarate/2-oxoacid ferredoxin oxidoreductase subunit beta